MPTPRKLSEIVKEMAWTMLRQPDDVSSQAMHAVLLLAHVAWNRAVGEVVPAKQYESVFAELVASQPTLWHELAGAEPEAMIDALTKLKRAQYPEDDRVIVACEMREGRVHVEWVEGEVARECRQAAIQELERVIDLIMSGDEDDERAAIRQLGDKTGLPIDEIRPKIEEIRRVLAVVSDRRAHR